MLASTLIYTKYADCFKIKCGAQNNRLDIRQQQRILALHSQNSTVNKQLYFNVCTFAGMILFVRVRNLANQIFSEKNRKKNAER